MKAKFPKTEPIQEGRNFAQEKEVVRALAAVVLHKDKLKEVVTARWYMGRSSSASVVYCSIWIKRANGEWWSGHGDAGGCGYHKESAAFQDALLSMGVALWEDGDEISIAGAGDIAIANAMEAIIRAAGYRGKYLLV